jgi:hypothetical protein
MYFLCRLLPICSPRCSDGTLAAKDLVGPNIQVSYVLSLELKLLFN